MAPSGKRIANILAFPALKKIPEPETPLTGAARDKYMELAKGLLHAGKLNQVTQVKCEHIAILHGQKTKRVAMNGVVSVSMLEAIDKLMKELQLVDESESVAPTPSGTENRFARIGVIVRPDSKKAELRSS